MLLHIVSSPKPGLGTKLIVLPTSLTAAQGWDVLLRAFLSAFTAADNVLLLLHTKPFHSQPDFPQQMQVGLGRAAALCCCCCALHVTCAALLRTVLVVASSLAAWCIVHPPLPPAHARSSQLF